MIESGKKYLVTLDSYFVAPDCEQYRAVWGEAKVHEASRALGLKPTRSTNWFLKVGTVGIAGCQIHFITECEERPKRKIGNYEDKDTKERIPFNKIYFTE